MKNLKYLNFMHLCALILLFQLYQSLSDGEDKLSDVCILVIFVFSMLSAQMQMYYDKLVDLIKESKGDK